jgi:hypothetical protein
MILEFKRINLDMDIDFPPKLTFGNLKQKNILSRKDKLEKFLKRIFFISFKTDSVQKIFYSYLEI